MGMTRSQNMARIKGKNTSPEMILRKELWAAGRRYRVHYKTSACKVDIAFPGRRVAILVDGCQWHGCPEHYVRPRSNAAFWRGKLEGNVERDRRQTLELEKADWRVLRFWEHEVLEDLENVIGRVDSALLGDDKETGPAWRVVRVEPAGPDDLENRYIEALREPQQKRSETKFRSTRKPRRRASASAMQSASEDEDS